MRTDEVRVLVGQDLLKGGARHRGNFDEDQKAHHINLLVSLAESKGGLLWKGSAMWKKMNPGAFRIMAAFLVKCFVRTARSSWFVTKITLEFYHSNLFLGFTSWRFARVSVYFSADGGQRPRR